MTLRGFKSHSFLVSECANGATRPLSARTKSLRSGVLAAWELRTNQSRTTLKQSRAVILVRHQRQVGRWPFESVEKPTSCLSGVMAAAPDLGSGAFGRGGSSPSWGTGRWHTGSLTDLSGTTGLPRSNMYANLGCWSNGYLTSLSRRRLRVRAPCTLLSH